MRIRVGPETDFAGAIYGQVGTCLSEKVSSRDTT